MHKLGPAPISVVTEEDFFQGDLGWVWKDCGSLPYFLSSQDFVYDSFQIYETRAAGAECDPIYRGHAGIDRT
jgi:indole-3-glycerol phosphate synthase